VRTSVKILVSGHHGYIGSVLVPVLAEADHEVVGLDTFYYRDCDFGPPADLPTTLEADLRDVGPSELEGFDGIVHLAALSNDPVGDLKPEWTYAINLDASVALARAAQEAGVSRFVFASSCSMYGAAGEDDVLDETAPLHPLTPYAESKVRAEEAILSLASDAFAPVSMRNATAYGVSPRLRLDVVLNNLVAWAHTTGAIRLLSDGTAWRPLVHVRDIAAATLALLEAPANAIRGEAFNVGTDEQNYRIRTLAEVVQHRLPQCSIEYAEGASTDARSYRVDFSKLAERLTGCRFEWTAERGVEELATAYEREGLTADEFTGRRYIRLGRLRYLLDTGELADGLRWAHAPRP
jgi:nucleoside-diphosphate-sugar epimerase